MWRIRQFKRRIINLISWFPIIWKDEQWDSYYIEKLLLHKIKRVRKYTEKRRFYEGWGNDVKWMMKCEYLLTMLTTNGYWQDEYKDKIPSINSIKKSYYHEYYEHNFKTTAYKDFFYSELWEEKARGLFWKIFVAQYEKWWD